MAWSQIKLTNEGKRILASIIANNRNLSIDEIWIGTGNTSASMTTLAVKSRQCGIISKTQEGSDAYIRFRMDNEGLTSNILIREIGFYTRNERNQLVLFSYMQDDEPATLPKKSDSGTYRQSMTTTFGFSDADRVTINATILEGRTKEQIDADILAHNTSQSAHENQFMSIKTSLNTKVETSTYNQGMSTKLDKTSADYIKTLVRSATGLTATNGANTQKVLDFITSNYNDGDTNKVLNLSALKNMLGQGAIVASKLDENGYIKFANNFVIQWGVDNATGGSSKWVRYPIAFKTVFTANATIFGNYNDSVIILQRNPDAFECTSHVNFVHTNRSARAIMWIATGIVH